MRRHFAVGCFAILCGVLVHSATGQNKANTNKEKPTYESMVQRLKSATEQDREKVKAEIKKQLDDEYTTFLKTRQKPIVELKAKLDKLQAEFDKKMSEYKEQENLKQVLVQHRLDSIWLQSQGLSWPGGKLKEIPTGNLKRKSKSGSTPVKTTKPQSMKTPPKKAIPTSKTFEVYLPGMV